MKLKKVLPLLALSLTIATSSIFAMASANIVNDTATTEADHKHYEGRNGSDITDTITDEPIVHDEEYYINQELKTDVDVSEMYENEKEVQREQDKLTQKILEETLEEINKDETEDDKIDPIDEVKLPKDYRNIDIGDFTISYIGKDEVNGYYDPVNRIVVYEKTKYENYENPFIADIHIYKKEENRKAWQDIKSNGEKGQDKNGHIYWEYTIDDSKDQFIAYRDCFYHIMYNDKTDIKQIKVVRH